MEPEDRNRIEIRAWKSSDGSSHMKFYAEGKIVIFNGNCHFVCQDHDEFSTTCIKDVVSHIRRYHLRMNRLKVSYYYSKNDAYYGECDVHEMLLEFIVKQHEENDAEQCEAVFEMFDRKMWAPCTMGGVCKEIERSRVHVKVCPVREQWFINEPIVDG